MKDLSGLQPWLTPYHQYAAAIMSYLTNGDVVPIVTSTYRSYDQQAELYKTRAQNPYPVNRPGDSAHQFGLAIDSDVPDQYMPLWIAVRRYVGFRVPDNDAVHGEVPNWRSLISS